MTGAADGPATKQQPDGAPDRAADAAAPDPGHAASTVEPAASDSKARTPFVVIDTASLDSHLIGSRLRMKREALGLRLQDVGSALNLKADVIRAIEDMDTRGVVQKAALRYTVRRIADRLGMSGSAQIAQAYFDQIADRIEDVPAETSQPIGRSQGGLPQGTVLLGATALAVMLALLVAHLSQPTRPDAQAQGPAGGLTDRLDPAALEAARQDAAKGKVTLMIRALRPAMIDVRGPDGTIYIQRVLKEGETYPPRMGASWTLSTRDAGAFRIYVNGVDTGFLGSDGQSVYAWRIDSAAGRLPAPAPPPSRLPALQPAPSSGEVPVAVVPMPRPSEPSVARPTPNPTFQPPRPVAETPALPPGVTEDQSEEEKRRAREAFEREVLDFN